jgi:hypothetical protein
VAADFGDLSRWACCCGCVGSYVKNPIKGQTRLPA